MDEDIRFFFDDRIHCRKEIVVHLLLAQVHAALRIEPVEGCEPEVGVGDVDEIHRIFPFGFYWDIRRGVVG